MKKLFFSLCTALIATVSCDKTNSTQDPSPSPDPTPVPVSVEYVDLGLSVKWASCNIGAAKPEEYGRYFAWGDVVGQTWDGEKWSGSGFSTSPAYELDENNNLKPEYDAAHVLLGGSWRMPTHEELLELIDNCTCTWTKDYNETGVAGRIVTSKKSGYTDKSIFLPAGGWGDGRHLINKGEYGHYRSSTLGYGDDRAWDLIIIFFNYSDHSAYTNSGFRYFGRSVRPVSE